MTEYEKLKLSTARTVGELIKILSKYNPDTKIYSSDSDIGGYDVSGQPYAAVKESPDKGSLWIGHYENEAKVLFDKGIITQEQLLEFDVPYHSNKWY